MVTTFGTDGIRGAANFELTAEVAVAVGRAAVKVLGGSTWLVGADPRLSGPMLVAALSAGLASAGADVVDLGVVPTPAAAYHSQRDGMPAAVVSASHNPFTDNGIKLFAAGGLKLSDDVEARIALRLRSGEGGGGGGGGEGGGDSGGGGDGGGEGGGGSSGGAVSADAPTWRDRACVGRIERHPGPLEAYADHVIASLGGRRLDGMRLVIDCANGAASDVAPRVLRALGASVRVLAAQPDGTNINAGCGSTHPDDLQALVVAEGADAGLAFDGDADRVVAVDHVGGLIDGDQILAVCAADRHRRGRLAGGAVVVTVMSNLGLRSALGALGIRVVETQVGDRRVLEALDVEGLSLGGEQSGHVVFRDLATTGDGLLTGVQLLDVVARSRRTLTELVAAGMTRLPQVLRNVRVADRDALSRASEVWEAVAGSQAELGATGRVLLRPSGTEPLVRVMVEASTEEEAAAVAERLSCVVERVLGAPQA